MADYSTGTGSGSASLHVNVSTSENVGGNYSTVHAELSIQNVGSATYINSAHGCSIYINGTWYGGSYTWASGGGSRVIQTIDVNIGHDGNGYLSFDVAGRIESTGTSGIGGATQIPTSTYSAPRIPKAPAAPTNIGIDQVTPTSFRYQFSGNDDGGSGITGWYVQVATDSGFTANVQTFNAGGSPYTVTGLANNTTYYARAYGTNAYGTSGYSNASSTTTTGHPTVPQNLTAIPSTSVTGRIGLSWATPATTGTGGITGYNIFRGGTQIATTTGTGTTYTDSGLTSQTSYTYTVAARNAYSNSISGVGPQTAGVVAVAPGPPFAPTGLTATASTITPGLISLAWTAPTTTGTGGITGYNIYFSTGSLAATTTGTGVTTDITGLNPGQTYSFYVTARNALADTEGSQSPQSNTATAQALGEPPAPSALTVTASTVVDGRLSLSWTPPAGGNTGYNVFDHNTTTNVDTLIATVKTAYYIVDNLAAGVSKSYFVRTRNTYTDTLPAGYPGNYGGPASTTVSATPNADFSKPVANITAASNATNSAFNGTYTINAVTPTTIRYAKTAANVAAVAASGSIVDNTNVVFNGSYTIATPTATTITYAKTNADIPSASVSGATLTDSTNITFNGTQVVTAVNVAAKTVTYARTAAAVASVAVPTNDLPGGRGTIANQTNAVYNGTGLTITALTPLTLQYAKTNANLAESNAAGTVTDTTNRDNYNGTKVITGIPTYNTFTYTTAGTAQASVAVSGAGGDAARLTSPAEMDIKYRSGWAG